MLNIIESQDSTYMSYELVVYLYYACRVTENKIKKILEEAEIIISAGKISNILTQEKRRRKSHMEEHDVMSILYTCKEADGRFLWLYQGYIFRKPCHDKICTAHFT